MSSTNSIHLSSDVDIEDKNWKYVEKRPRSYLETVSIEGINNMKKVCRESHRHHARYEPEDDISSNENNCGVLDQVGSQIDNSRPGHLPSVWPAPICRQFWKAGNYDKEQSAKITMKNGNSRMRIHPQFLHSNATSHMWAFGAIAELLDNAVDENGATFVVIDKTTNPRDGSPALLIQDDGGGMDPEAIRHCMSFGFSDKKRQNAIGQYGNGFKTSSMRLGSDVIVFTRRCTERALCQSVGLLSYTFLRQTGQDRIVVPMVDYEFKESTGNFYPMHYHGKEQFSLNLSALLQWSPYSTEETLLKQFDNIGQHGTKIVIYNLWLNDNEDMELDFHSDAEDIRINVDTKVIQTGHNPKPIQDQHITNLYQFSLRVYASILYLRLPQSFKIVLRGRQIEHHNIADDLKYIEFILYKPHVGLNSEVGTVTTIGFLKDAPHLNVHGFSVYHRNRLILPFWRVVRNTTNSTARGIVGVLEANFIQPTHNKQDFERTSLFQKLETRLKDMTLEYWDLHCGLIGYQQTKKSRSATVPRRRQHLGLHNHVAQPVPLNPGSSENLNLSVHEPSSSAVESTEYPIAASNQALSRETMRNLKEKNYMMASEPNTYNESGSCATDTQDNEAGQPSGNNKTQLQNIETSLQDENRKLQSRLLDLEKREEALNIKAQQLRDELAKLQQEYDRLLAELVLLIF